MDNSFEINGRRIGPGAPAYIIAEMSANHGQSFDEAVKIIKAAKQAGADAIKLQTYTADTLTIDCDNSYFRIQGTLWDGRTLYDLYGEAYTPWEWQPKLKNLADEIGLDLFSTPFDDSAVDFLEGMQVPAHKIASFENCDIALLRKVARTGKPIIVSTGMATSEEIDEVVRTIREAGGKQLALLKCTSAYPASPDEMNLRTIPHLAQTFGVPVGLSDHTLGSVVAVAAVSLGACIVEKHFTLSRGAGGPDSAFSLEPEEFKAMVDGVRVAEKALGTIHYGLSPAEEKSRVFRRSLFVVDDIAAGEPFTERNVRSIRPGHGLHPRHLDQVLGRRATRDIRRGTPLEWSMAGERHEARRAGNAAR
jgi:N-acetylneuraminate synthase